MLRAASPLTSRDPGGGGGGRPQGEPHSRLTQAHAAQGGVTLGPEQGDLGANFVILAYIIYEPLPRPNLALLFHMACN
jgi:hypothetical protein